jgi:anti-sigma factor ChrR (cupin superfamily)
VVSTRLQHELEGGRRFHHLAARVASLFDVSEELARALLDRIDETDAWMPGDSAGLALLPVEAGARCEGAFTCLMRLDPNAQIEMHEHAAREEVLVLQGGYLDSRGRELWRGEHEINDAGSSHGLCALDGLACVVAIVLCPGAG